MNPQIYITDEKYDLQNLHYIILHEYNHWKRKDIWKKTGLFLLSSIMWWNPFSYILRNEFIQILEFRCDSSLCTNLSPQEETEYLGTLFRTNEFLNKNGKKIKTSSTTMEFIGTRKTDQSTLRQRFSLLIYKQEKGHGFMKLLLLFLVCGWMFTSYYFLPQPYYTPIMSDDEEMIFYNDITIKELDDNTYFLDINDERHDLDTNIVLEDKAYGNSSFFNYTFPDEGFIKKYIRKLRKKINYYIK